jgi:hypothetical protein
MEYFVFTPRVAAISASVNPVAGSVTTSPMLVQLIFMFIVFLLK